MQVKISLSPNLISRNQMPPFKFAVYQEIPELEVLYENDCCRVIDDVLQSSFAVTQGFVRFLLFFSCVECNHSIRQAVCKFGVLVNRAFIESVRFTSIKAQ